MRARFSLALLRQVEWRCAHVPWPPAPGPETVVVLASRTIVCRRPGCEPLLRKHWRDDGRCELCEQESDRFTPHIAPLGAALIKVELCGECSTWLAAA